MSQSRPTGSGQKTILAIMGVLLAAMFFASFFSRMGGTPTQVTQQQKQPSMPPAGMQDAQSDAIGQMMVQLSEDPTNVELLTSLADKFMTMQSYEQASVFLMRAAAADPFNAKVMNMLGVAMYRQQKYPDAADYFEQVLELEPDHDAATFNLGVLYKHHLEKPDKADELFQSILDMEDAQEALKEEARKELATHGD